MAEYEQTLLIHCKPDQIFDFIADIRNLPRYLPTTKAAQPQGEDRVRVQGEAHEHSYDSDGYLRPDRDAMRLEWGADEGYYKGWMQVKPDGTGSFVTVHISLHGQPPGADPNHTPSDEEINEGLMTSLRSIQNQMEGHGGKEEPRAAT
jgi:hypothetical protein